jgi:hypothetical protein
MDRTKGWRSHETFIFGRTNLVECAKIKLFRVTMFTAGLLIAFLMLDVFTTGQYSIMVSSGPELFPIIRNCKCLYIYIFLFLNAAASFCNAFVEWRK